MSNAQRKPLKNATFRIPKSVWQRAKTRAVGEDRSLNEVVLTALEAYAGHAGRPGARLLADADRFVKQRGPNAGAPRFTPDELHERDDA